MPNTDPTVFVVDDEHTIRQSLQSLIRSVGLNVETFSSGTDFLRAFRSDRRGCVLLDIRMPRMSGLEVQKELSTAHMTLPIIIMTGHGDVTIAVGAMKNGAFDFIEKPFSDGVLVERIQQAIAYDARSHVVQVQKAQVAARLAILTRREREVLELIATGRSNKEAAAKLGISRKTVEVHRGHFMEKMQVESLAELVEMMTRTRLLPNGSVHAVAR